MKESEFKGNRIAYYNKNFGRPDSEEWVYAIIDSGNPMFQIAEFRTMEQLRRFAEKLHFEFSFDGHEGRCSKILTDDIAPYISDEKPDGAEYLWSLSNGSIVRNWFMEQDGVICVHRINGNNKKLYRPLPLDEHIRFQRENGIY